MTAKNKQMDRFLFFQTHRGKPAVDAVLVICFSDVQFLLMVFHSVPSPWFWLAVKVVCALFNSYQSQQPASIWININHYQSFLSTISQYLPLSPNINQVWPLSTSINQYQPSAILQHYYPLVTLIISHYEPYSPLCFQWVTILNHNRCFLAAFQPPRKPRSCMSVPRSIRRASHVGGKKSAERMELMLGGREWLYSNG